MPPDRLSGEARHRYEQRRRHAVYGVLAVLVVLAGLSMFNTFVTAPDERDDIRETAEQAQTVADALAKSNAGVTALICTSTNRSDAIDSTMIGALLPGARQRDAESGTAVAANLTDTLDLIPPAENCGELICQFFREIDEPGAIIEIKDPFGPNRPESPCGEAPPPVEPPPQK